MLSKEQFFVKRRWLGWNPILGILVAQNCLATKEFKILLPFHPTF
jgi:hypothetical protein